MGSDAARRSLEAQASPCFSSEKAFPAAKSAEGLRLTGPRQGWSPKGVRLTTSGLAIFDPTTRNSKYGKRMSKMRGKIPRKEPGDPNSGRCTIVTQCALAWPATSFSGHQSPLEENVLVVG